MAVRLFCTVRGLVQGVGFRYYVCRKAVELGANGWVRNVRDGSVELLAEGEREILESLLASIRHGPRAAIVQDLSVEWGETDGEYSSFEIR